MIYGIQTQLKCVCVRVRVCEFVVAYNTTAPSPNPLSPGIPNPTSSVAQLTTNHCGISNVPQVVTDGAPLAVDTHLHSAPVLARSTNQTQLCRRAIAGDTLWEERNKLRGFIYTVETTG